MRPDRTRSIRAATPVRATGAGIAAPIVFFFLLRGAGSDAGAVLLRVDWSATVGDVAGGATGALSGSLGQFEVTAIGQEFALPADGSLGVTASGFTSGFPNGTWPFLEYDTILVGAGTGLILRFDAIDPPAVSLIPVGANLAYLSTFSQTTPCFIGGDVGFCAIVLGRNNDQVLIPGDLAGIYANTSGIGNQSRAAQVAYTFTELSAPPVPAARAAARWVLAGALLAVAGRRFRRGC
jgi:hypothetical protein